MNIEVKTPGDSRIVKMDGKKAFSFSKWNEDAVIQILSAAVSHAIMTGKPGSLIIDGQVKIGTLDELLGPAAA
jgi:hypothetical protein